MTVTGIPSRMELGLVERYALRPGVYLADLPTTGIRLLAWPHAESLGRLDDGLRAVLSRLTGGAADLDLLGELTATHRTTTTALVAFLERLRRGGWLAVTVCRHGTDLYTIRPHRPPAPPAVPPLTQLRLSRFAVVRREGTDILVESPRSWGEVHVHHPSVLAALAGDRSLGATDLRRLHEDLHAAGLTDADDGDQDLRTLQWSPHELWFHERSRLHHRGYLGSGFGGTFWARDRFPSPPARPPAYPGRPVPLIRPDLDEVRRTDPSLTAVLEDRRSVRVHDDRHPITVTELGEFLYRCARTRLVRDVDGVEYMSRPHPSGGSVYELEIYPVVRLADGLDPGMYHYDSHDHLLRPVRGREDPAVRRLLRVAAHGSATSTPPQVLFTISARVGRLMWKYEQMAYALMLKHVGVLQQTMYCVATAMGLAVCGLGGGDAAAFTAATGRDPLVECSVGELALGTVLR